MKDPRNGKHSHNNRASREGQVLRFIREVRKLSLQDVAAKMDIKALDVDHFENGRKFYSPEDVSKFLLCYNFPEENFTALMNLKILTKQLVNHYITSSKL